MPKVKLVAIAKDEGAYLPEWVFHHLHFGFDSIDIYINRTNDNSMKILHKISSLHPNVHVYNADWIDMCHADVKKRIQTILYAKALAEVKINKEYTHILFLDIDEFWTPMDFESSIHKCITSLPEHATISFQWFNVIGQKIIFDDIPSKFDGYLSPLVKSVINTDSEFKTMRLHIPKINHKIEKKQNILSDGSDFISSQQHDQHLDKQFDKLKPYFIMHRMNRSEQEYLALLYKGNPEQQGVIKLNRKGYDARTGILSTVLLDKNLHDRYLEEKDLFIKSLDLDTELEEARKFVLKMTNMTISQLSEIKISEYTKLKRVLSGVNDIRVISFLDTLDNTKK